MNIPVDGNDDHVIAVEAEVFVADIIHLTEDHQGGDDKEEGDRELDNDEDAAEAVVAAGDAEARAEDADQAGVGENEGGVSAGQSADEERGDQKSYQRSGLEQIVPDKVFAGKGIEDREQLGADDGGEDCHGDEGDQQGFTGELGEELAFGGAEDLADADLAGAAGGLGDSEVGIVEAGDSEDEDGDDCQDVDGRDAAVGGKSIQFGIEVDAGQGFEVVDQGSRSPENPVSARVAGDCM